MSIEDIQLDGDIVEILFVDDEVKEVLRLRISKEDAWKMAKYCMNALSYKTEKP